MVEKDRCQIRQMKRDELNLVIEWVAEEGWNPGLHDAEAFYNTDPEGFLVATLNDELIGAISAVSYGDKFGFIGLYIVKPEYRGEFHAARLGRAAQRRLRKCNVGLDGVVERIDNYQRIGFKLAYHNIRYQGESFSGRQMNGLQKLSDIPFELISKYDQMLFPAPRDKFLQSWLSQPRANGYGIISDGHLTGFGLIRPCHVGFKIGPLYADTPEVADTLYCALSSSVEPGMPVSLDAPEVNYYTHELVKRYQMKPVFKTARMYSDTEPLIPIQKVYGVTSFELG